MSRRRLNAEDAQFTMTLLLNAALARFLAVVCEDFGDDNEAYSEKLNEAEKSLARVLHDQMIEQMKTQNRSLK